MACLLWGVWCILRSCYLYYPLSAKDIVTCTVLLSPGWRFVKKEGPIHRTLSCEVHTHFLPHHMYFSLGESQNYNLTIIHTGYTLEWHTVCTMLLIINPLCYKVRSNATGTNHPGKLPHSPLHSLVAASKSSECKGPANECEIFSMHDCYIGELSGFYLLLGHLLVIEQIS